MFYFALQPDGNATARDLIDFQKMLGLPFSFTVTKGWVFCNATAYLSLCMNITHMYTAYQAAKDKRYAVYITIPLFQTMGMIAAAYQYSNFWKEYSSLFLLGIGMFFGSMVNRFNLMSCAQSYFDPLYADPVVFLLILLADSYKLYSDKVVLFCYFALMMTRILAYVIFMSNLIGQMCVHLNIPFLYVGAYKTKNK